MGYIKGIRKQAHSSRYSYRIHLRLPDGRKVNLEKGGFLTPEEAAVARCLKIEELTTNNPIITSKPFEEVFWEYIKSSCSATPSLRKKYIAIYKNHVQKALGQIEVCESFEALLSLKTKLCNSLVYDGRSNERQVFLSSSYISEIKAMLTNIYDYAFVQKYISSHPMYRLGRLKEIQISIILPLHLPIWVTKQEFYKIFFAFFRKIFSITHLLTFLPEVEQWG